MRQVLPLLPLLLATAATATAAAYSVGGLLFRATRGVRYVKSSDYDAAARRRMTRAPRGTPDRGDGDGDGGGKGGAEEDALALAGKFFVDAFW